VAGPGLTYALLRNSQVQTWLVQRVAAYLSKELDTRVEVGGLDVSFFMNIVLSDVQVDDRQGNPMIQSRRMVFDIGRISLRHQHITINKLFVEEAFLALRKLNGSPDYNFRFLIDYFAGEDKSDRSDTNRWDLVCKSLEFSQSGFILENMDGARAGNGFDLHDVVIDDFHFAVHDIFLDDRLLSFVIESMSFTEPRGFDLVSLSGDFLIGPEGSTVSHLQLRTPKTDLLLDASFLYQGYEAFNHMYEDVGMTLEIKQSNLNMADLGFYLPALYGMQNVIQVQGELSGKLSDLQAERFLFSYGMDTDFKGSFRVSGLPDPARMRFDFFVDQFQTSIDDIAGFRLPASEEFPNLRIPDHLYTLGKLGYRGRVSGQMNDFFARGSVITNLGGIDLGVNIKNDLERGNAYLYSGSVNSQGFDIGTMFARNDQVGHVSLNAEVEGQGVSLETLELDITGEVHSLELFGYEYQNLGISGAVSNRMFNGSLVVADPNLTLEFLGMISFEGTIPVFDFNASVDNANLTALNLYQRIEDAGSRLSGNISIKASGGNLDELQGNMIVSDIVYEEVFSNDPQDPYSEVYKTSQISIMNTNFAGLQKHLLIRSDFVDASLSGEILFDDLLPAVRRFLSVHIPAVRGKNSTSRPFKNGDSLGEPRQQNFQFKALFKDTELLSELFFPYVRLSKNAALYVDFDSSKDLVDITGRADMFSLFGNRLTDWNLMGSMSAGGYQVTNQGARLYLTDSLFLDNFCLDGILFNDSLLYEANWRTWDDDSNSHGHVQGITEFLGEGFARLRFLPSYAMINDSRWQVNPDHEVYFDSARIEVSNLVIYNADQSMKIDGLLDPDPKNRMHVYFQDFAFSNIEALLNVPKMHFDGIMNGNISFAALFQRPAFETYLLIDDFVYNYEHLGDMVIQSVWDDISDGFRVSAILTDPGRPDEEKPLLASGFVYPKRDDDQLDLDILVDRLSLSIWSRYLDGILDGFHGFATGRLRLAGRGSDPALSGMVYAENAGFRVDYLNTGYRFAHQVEFGKNFISFDEMIITDTLNNSGLVSGTVYHTKFKNFSLDVLLRPERMIVLNTNSSHNELYYGKAFASGIMHIHGPQDDITMDISARTQRGTQVFLPLTYTGELIENSFINFVSRDTVMNSVAFPPPNIAGLTLNFDLEVTPEADVQLIFDSQIGDVIRGRGSGNLKMEVTSQGAFNMYGEYVIDEGEYLFTLQNLINKRFRIQQGGTIRWTGDPNDADIDLRAAYRLRTALYDLMMDLDTTDMYRRRVPVDCILILKDRLVNPEISFDIHLPGGDESTRELIERRITTEQEMNRQVFSLLVLNRFLPATTDQYNTALGYGVGSTSSELLSNQLSNWLSQISSEFDIGINYRPGDQISSQELEVALSTQLFDDRVIIDGNFGVAGTHASTNQRTSNIIGDINVEVKITPEGKFRIKAFNRSNTIDIINVNSPYTQGVGVFYRKEFDSIFDLFKRSYRPEEITSATE
jgi:hypothetical protein